MVIILTRLLRIIILDTSIITANRAKEESFMGMAAHTLGNSLMMCLMGKGISNISIRINMSVSSRRAKRKEEALITSVKGLYLMEYGLMTKKFKENLLSLMAISSKGLSATTFAIEEPTNTKMETFTTVNGKTTSNTAMED